jgi:3-oxoacyl-[acyl-carrier-protein] synthase III
MAPNAVITGWGMYAPSRVMTNDDLAKIVDTTDEWIVSRTGIRERRIAGDDETTTTLSVHAASDALAVAGLDPMLVDLVIVATCSPDYPLPATSVTVATALGATRAAGFDLQAACSGFLFGLATGSSFIRSGMYRNVLVIGVEVLSRFLNWNDRNTCVLFGDGAGAVLLQATRGDHGILGSIMKANGAYHDLICMPGGGSDHPANDPKSIEQRLPYIKMKGNETFKVAVKAMADVSTELLTEQGFTKEQVNLFIPHQANLRIINAVGERLKIDPARVYKNVDRFGNTSAASIPIALDECVREGKVHDGDMVLLTAFGAGLVWGSVLLRW